MTKRIKLTDSLKTYAYGTRRNVPCKKEAIKYNYIIKQWKK